jgi:hypothetical protein
MLNWEVCFPQLSSTLVESNRKRRQYQIGDRVWM